jgi:hypothetical protein
MIIVESIWLHILAYKLFQRVVFPLGKYVWKKLWPTLAEKTLITYVQLALTTCTFDLCMSKGAYDIFAIVTNFILNNKEPKHMTIGLFEMINIGACNHGLEISTTP